VLSRRSDSLIRQAKQTTKSNTVIAVSTGSNGTGPYKAVMLRKVADDFEVVWHRISPAEADIGTFLSELIRDNQPTEGSPAPQLVVAMDSAMAAIYHLELPPVKDSQLDGIIRMQAESLLPLPVDQMEMTWRVDSPDEQIRTCTLVAARRDTVETFLTKMRAAHVNVVAPDCEGTIRTWRQCFGGDLQPALILHVRRQDTRVLLTQQGVLSQALTIDVGSIDLNDSETKTESKELFAHDLSSAMERFSADSELTDRVFVLADNSQAYSELLSHLKEKGLIVHHSIARPNVIDIGFDVQGSVSTEETAVSHSQVFAAEGELSPDIMFEYLEPIGTGMLALDEQIRPLNLLEAGQSQKKEEKLSSSSLILLLTSIAAVAMIIVFLIVGKRLDMAELERMENSKLSELVAIQKTQQRIADERPDILDILTKLNESIEDGMLIDSFIFQKDKPIQIASSAASYEQLYKFQKTLQSKNGIKDVDIQSPSLDSQGRKVNFKMTFRYRDFCGGK
ncbi:MAG: PilN domain-containing protein, partial [Sedimentisphaerales bacterium]|nr:PilN domain-containing protein [Sedimentisphaerales bacterium]